MKIHRTLVPALILGLLATMSSAQKANLKIGSTAPPLDCKGANDKKLDWKDCGDRCVVLFFHSEDMPYSQRALNEVCEALVEDGGLTQSLFLLLVTNGSRDVNKLDATLKKTGMPYAITVDEKRLRFPQFHVIAFPTVFTLDKKRVVRHIDKGYGPMLKSKVVAAARHATGKIDADIYRALVASPSEAKLSGTDVRVNRTVRMVTHLVNNGMFEEARRALERVLTPDTEHVKGISALVDVLLRLKQTDRAALWIGRLRKVDSTAIMLPVLRAELAIQRNAPDEALKLLDKHRPPGVRAKFLRGRALEQKGQFEEAARHYREALRDSLGRDT